MHNLIDDSYFWGERHLPKLSGVTSTTLGRASQAMASEIEMYIAKYQKYYLEAMFGETVANALPDEIAEMLFDEETKTSPIADCVYFFVMAEQNSGVMLPTGNKTLTIQNTAMTNPSPKMVKAWNAMVRFNLALHKKLYEQETFGDYSWKEDVLEAIDEKHEIYHTINEYIL